MPIEVKLAELPDGQREAAEAVLAHLEAVGELIVEAVGVGILVKRASTFIELRPKTKWLALSFILDREIEDRRISRTVLWGDVRAHFIRLTSPADVDAQVRRWLTASYKAAKP